MLTYLLATHPLALRPGRWHLDELNEAHLGVVPAARHRPAGAGAGCSQWRDGRALSVSAPAERAETTRAQRWVERAASATRPLAGAPPAHALSHAPRMCVREARVGARGGAHSGARWCVPDDASVPALPLGVALRRVLKHRVHEVLVVHPRHRLPALVQRAVLGQRDDVLDVLADGLGLHARAGARTRGRVRAMHATWSAFSQSGAPRCSVPPASSRGPGPPVRPGRARARARPWGHDRRAARSRRAPRARAPYLGLGRLDAAVAQHLGGQRAQQRLALVGRAAEAVELAAVAHHGHEAAVGHGAAELRGRALCTARAGRHRVDGRW